MMVKMSVLTAWFLVLILHRKLTETQIIKTAPGTKLVSAFFIASTSTDEAAHEKNEPRLAVP